MSFKSLQDVDMEVAQLAAANTEADLEALLQSVSQELDRARAAHDAQSDQWRIVQRALAKKKRERLPRPEELTYAFAKCACGSRMAYWPLTDAHEWDCAEVLLGTAGGDVAHSEALPFAFYSVKAHHECKSPR